jgi:hypothetical protein
MEKNNHRKSYSMPQVCPQAYEGWKEVDAGEIVRP